MKTQDLIGAQLDWAVAKCENPDISIEHFIAMHSHYAYVYDTFDYSANWSEGGPIIEHIKGLEFKHWLESKPESCCEAHIHNYEGDWIAFGPTPLIAAMRVYVMAKHGDEINIPEELL